MAFFGFGRRRYRRSPARRRSFVSRFSYARRSYGRVRSFFSRHRGRRYY